MKRWIRTTLIIVVVALIVVLLRYTVFRPEVVPVTVFRAARGLVEESVTNSKAGTVMTRKRAMLNPEVGGRVEVLEAREGDRVRGGDVLMRLADADYRAQRDLREGSLNAASAAKREACLAAHQAEREYARYLGLAEEQIVSKELLDQLESTRDVSVAACDSAEARVREAQASVEVARVQLAKTVLRAPFDAVVAEVGTEIGEWITPSPPGVPIAPVVELIDPASIYISAPLDEVDLTKVRVGQPVRITLDAYPDRSIAGRLSRIAPYVLDVEEHSRTFEIEAELEDQEFAQTLLPGASADVEVILRAKPGVLRVPSYALIEGNRVLLVDGDTLVDRPVDTGLKNWAFTEVTDGLAEGELVVVSLDRAEVAEGARVRVTDETLR